MKVKNFVDDLVRGEVPDKQTMKSQLLRDIQISETKELRQQSGLRMKRAVVCLASLVGVILLSVWLMNSQGFNPWTESSQTLGTIDNPALGTNDDPTLGSNVDQTALFVPKMEMPILNANEAADMVAFFIYQSEVYIQAEMYFADEALRRSELLGEKLAYVTGRIDEWTRADDYVEFAGSVAGDIYTVEGYDPSFRLAIDHRSVDEDGKQHYMLSFYERLNNISLDTGADLFKDKLKLNHHWQTLDVQTDADWNHGTAVFSKLDGLSREEINSFIDALFSGNYLHLDYESNQAFYSESTQRVHLFFTMADGTRISLVVVEGGYVAYQQLSWYFVKVPAELVDQIFRAMA